MESGLDDMAGATALIVTIDAVPVSFSYVAFVARWRHLSIYCSLENFDWPVSSTFHTTLRQPLGLAALHWI